MFSIEETHEFLAQGKIQITDHALKRMIERDMDIKTDIIPALMSGEIIEEYPDDYPYESCLILGLSGKRRYAHVVCAIGEDVLWIITAYYPSDAEWEKDYKTRKGC